MANYIPSGWRMSPDKHKKFMSHLEQISVIVKRHAQKYNIQGLDRDDLYQEGLMSAAYAVDTFEQDRGNLFGYISSLVFNALAMVAAENLAQRRNPSCFIEEIHCTHAEKHKGPCHQGRHWRRAPAQFEPLEAEEVPHIDGRPDTMMEQREKQQDDFKQRWAAREHLNNIGLSTDAKQLLGIKSQPPAELMITARNMTGKHRLDSNVLASHLGWARGRVNRAVSELKTKLPDGVRL